ncbi:MAG: hypothetical protein KJ927_12225 [Candidatus Eisenbacteria bacterium]|nr:hypothetical protein [Candidatus Eisenbacteria bacterium]MBU1949473.1 hypothetical protein [Candidatus Eisenbacteria bacterium]
MDLFELIRRGAVKLIAGRSCRQSITRFSTEWKEVAFAAPDRLDGFNAVRRSCRRVTARGL